MRKINMKLRSTSSLGALMMLGVVASSNMVHAQGVQDATEAEGNVVDVIVVTSRGMTEVLSEVPDSITYYGAEAIDNMRMDNITDIAALTPGIGWKQDLSPTSTFISVRGLTSTRNTDPAASFWIDGVQLSNASQLRQQLFDVQSIEVLKGPQGSLYGRNALGGAFVITTKDPTNDLEGQMTAGYGNAERFDFSAALSGPIVEDKLYYRISGAYHDDNGSIFNPTVGSNVDFDKSKTARAKVIWTPNENSELSFRFSYDTFYGGNYYYEVTRPFGDPFPTNNPQSNSNTFDGFAPLSDPISTVNSDILSASMKFEHEFESVTLSSVTGYDKTDEEYGLLGEGIGGNGPGDLDFGPLNVIGNEQTYGVKSIQEDLRLSSNNFDSPFQWMAGVYFIDIDRNDTLPVFVDGDGDGAIADDAPFFPNGTVRNIKAYAAYGQATYDITPDLELTMGLRFDKEERDQTNLDEAVAALADQEASFELLQPKASLAWKFDEDHLLYGTISRGFRSGGFNAPRSLFDNVYDQEEVWNYELGYKGSNESGTVKFMGALFYEKIDNKQDFVFDAATAAQIIYNIPESFVYGVEAELTVRPTENFTFKASGAWMDSEIQDFKFGALFPTPLVDTQIEGNKLPTFSHWSLTLTADYVKPLSNSDWEFFAHSDVTARGKNYWNITNLDRERTVTLVNANIGFQNEKWKISLWAENLTNTKYWSNWFNQDTSALPDIGQRGEQRRYGIQTRVRF